MDFHLLILLLLIGKFIHFIRGLSPKYYVSIIRAVIVIFPYIEQFDIPKSPYGFDFFFRKINGASKENVEIVVKNIIFRTTNLFFCIENNRHSMYI